MKTCMYEISKINIFPGHLFIWVSRVFSVLEFIFEIPRWNLFDCVLHPSYNAEYHFNNKIYSKSLLGFGRGSKPTTSRSQDEHSRANIQDGRGSVSIQYESHIPLYFSRNEVHK